MAIPSRGIAFNQSMSRLSINWNRVRETWNQKGGKPNLQSSSADYCDRILRFVLATRSFANLVLIPAEIDTEYELHP